MRIPPLLTDFIHDRVCKPNCEKMLTLPFLPQPLGRIFWIGTIQAGKCFAGLHKKSPFEYRKDKPAERSTKAGAARLRASCFYIVPAVLQHCGDFLFVS